jgi:hypothetical protein
MSDLWSNPDSTAWRDALGRYDAVLEAQVVDRLPELDRWYRDALPAEIARRSPPHIDRAGLVRVTQWKMARGVWRARNLALVRGNSEEQVVEVSTEALAQAPDPRRPIAILARLAGVGPATASAVAAAAAPETYPFFDDVAARQVPELGKVAYTLGYYGRYADALRARAAELGGDWTPVMVERALWSHGGGKGGNAEV